MVCLPAFMIHARMFTDSSDAVLQRRIGANKFFFMSLTWWGIASLSFVYAKSYVGLLVLRCANLTFASLCPVLKRVHTGCFWELAKRDITLAWYITYRSGTRGEQCARPDLRRLLTQRCPDMSLPCESGDAHGNLGASTRTDTYS